MTLAEVEVRRLKVVRMLWYSASSAVVLAPLPWASWASSAARVRRLVASLRVPSAVCRAERRLLALAWDQGVGLQAVGDDEAGGVVGGLVDALAGGQPGDGVLQPDPGHAQLVAGAKGSNVIENRSSSHGILLMRQAASLLPGGHGGTPRFFFRTVPGRP
jgi:hypothetical protein